jgi:ABC-type phosphate/phosphonate transport system permease subunit
MKTITLAMFIFAVPLVLILMGAMVGLLCPEAGSMVFKLAWHAFDAIKSNYLHYWPLTVPVTCFVVAWDVLPEIARAR